MESAKRGSVGSPLCWFSIAEGHLAKAIHPSTVIASDVSIGEGTVIMAGVVVNTGGRFAIINTGATVDHDNVIEDGVHISPGCHLAGDVVCRADVFIGTGTSIIPRTQIGARAVVGAGAAVISDVPSDVLAVGCPAVVKPATIASTARSSEIIRVSCPVACRRRR